MNRDPLFPDRIGIAEKQRVLLFSPFTGIWPHALSEVRLLEQLPSSDFEIEFLTCGMLFPNFCTVMESRGIPLTGESNQKRDTCLNCISNAKLLSTHLFPRAQVQFLSNFYFHSDELDVKAATAGLSPNDFQDFIFRELPLGRIASYEVLIKYKKISLEFDADEWNYFFETLENCIRVAIAGTRFFQKYSTDAVLSYSPQYGITGTFTELASSKGIKTYFVEGSANIAEKYKAVRIWDWQEYKLMNPALKYWSTLGAQGDISLEEKERVLRHFREIKKARSHDVYSPGERGLSSRKYFAVKAPQKLVLLTTSSYDEVFSGAMIRGYPRSHYASDVYLDQQEWVRDTIAWVSKNPDVFLIVRLHPRDLPNKRERVLSEQNSRWATALGSLPPNVAVDHPDMGYSLDDHLNEIDLLVTGWSSTALEAMSRGISVITYDANLPRFPSSIHITGRSKEEYYANLEKIRVATRHWSIRDQMFEWLAFSLCRGTIQLSGRLRDQELSLRLPILRFGLVALERLLPKLSRRLDLSLPVADVDGEKFKVLLKKNRTSLFEL